MTRSFALVTGGAHRLGRDFALSLARMDYDILLHFHSAEDDAQRVKAEIEALGRQAHLLKANLDRKSVV